MEADPFDCVVLEIDPGEPIAGRIVDVSGAADSFRGWIELSSKIERLRTPPTPPASDAADDGPKT